MTPINEDPSESVSNFCETDLEVLEKKLTAQLLMLEAKAIRKRLRLAEITNERRVRERSLLRKP